MAETVPCLPGFTHCPHVELKGTTFETVRCCWCGKTLARAMAGNGHAHGPHSTRLTR